MSTTTIGSGELHEKPFQYQLEAGNWLFGWGLGVYNPSDPT